MKPMPNDELFIYNCAALKQSKFRECMFPRCLFTSFPIHYLPESKVYVDIDKYPCRNWHAGWSTLGFSRTIVFLHGRTAEIRVYPHKSISLYIEFHGSNNYTWICESGGNGFRE